ncbi:MAG: CoA transferase [Alphaproteobacteria bacterium]|jgi:crotonobetainyl-CoA:carnitine CoA-transferase CaiB-like acyl-CoA transferase|nr:CoA transferase [Rhodospirillaceae bacterium]MDP6020448.1 CoA transferase [Alphaproteobacteria bacterium]MDP6256028.1 CoA transferase [Alphaproteobacteria bacterium]MDP7052730.1 CoA transferase [Alphaproteobacteria bacterium]MDP7229848.1 CoA transferase [Alphaproteobacteria bacterium]|tara:strand:- start:11331 stop:12536 length:1206 start_codon:yes stop_codon:yes gene_type:complete
MSEASAKPFEGVRVLDFTQVFAGPFGSYQLAVLGADVIKVERPGGEEMRNGPLSREWSDRGMAPGWLAINANKRNIALDLKDPKALEIVKRLVKNADVVTENFRPGVMERLGIGYEALSAINPQLIYCAVSGFGQNGPERNTPSYDGRIQAVSGIMSITGHEGTGPTRAGFAVCDAIGGMTSAFAVASALFQRTHTGKGQCIDVAMLDSTLAFLSPLISEHTTTGHVHGQYGNQAISRRPTANLFKVGDDNLLLAVNTEKQFQALMGAIGQPELLDDPRFADWHGRTEHEPALREIIETAFASDDIATWEARLAEAGAPASQVRNLKEAINHPQLEHRDVLQTVESPFGSLKLVANGFRLAHGGASIDRAPVAPGADAEEILGEAGYDVDEIVAFRTNGVI